MKVPFFSNLLLLLGPVFPAMSSASRIDDRNAKGVGLGRSGAAGNTSEFMLASRSLAATVCEFVSYGKKHKEKKPRWCDWRSR